MQAFNNSQQPRNDGQYRNMGEQSSKGPPPTSSARLSKMVPIQVTADDLLEATNRECVMCLEEQKIGDLATKLPCGHLFHVDCVKQWLQLHCTWSVELIFDFITHLLFKT